MISFQQLRERLLIVSFIRAGFYLSGDYVRSELLQTQIPHRSYSIKSFKFSLDITLNDDASNGPFPQGRWTCKQQSVVEEFLIHCSASSSFLPSAFFFLKYLLL